MGKPSGRSEGEIRENVKRSQNWLSFSADSAFKMVASFTERVADYIEFGRKID
jgi:hypothetical protein